MKAWDTVVVKADAASVTFKDMGDGQPRQQVSTPHPFAGRAGVVQSASYDRDGKPVSAVVKFDETADGKPSEVAEVAYADVNVHHVF
ncbi:hypothetical protein M3A49_40765 [Paraburkholderia sp. CNPSo 3076]|uniref:hypothetical protein n=1 Tax=Paraburkholderia sp. CNPSo 3076 TaxID=2940936 RepID=UPI00225447F6|nr:hypothetical protein [Paraburkholderia sp. CNPSo 3076]MCX5545680.1 hypothetical protein [Paraburkholderia sp. CNPSo 3076]